jgi:hypothetical protein
MLLPGKYTVDFQIRKEAGCHRREFSYQRMFLTPSAEIALAVKIQITWKEVNQIAIFLGFDMDRS